MKLSQMVVCGTVVLFTSTVSLIAAGPTIGERPAVEHHLEQSYVEGGEISFMELFEHGGLIFNAQFNTLDGQGRPASTGTGDQRIPDQPRFIRTSSPDSNSCSGCHAQPRPGGSGDFVAIVFVLAQALDPVIDSVDGQFSNERNTLGMFGAGPIEMLAREMSEELITIRDDAKQEAHNIVAPVTRELWAKGVYFGRITVLPNGLVDPSEIEGVDWDLIIKPFHQKGAVVSLREFTNNAMNHHHGIQSAERFGPGTDADQDGMADELTIGDITAATIFQAALATPSRVKLKGPRKAAARRGERIFDEVGCTSCHVSKLKLNSRFFTEPNPFNPTGNLHPDEVESIMSFDMTKDGEKPRLKKTRDGGAIVKAFTNLKRHNLNDAELNHFANEQLPQGMLNGFAPPSDFTIDPEPRPTEEFLTRKLWDVGNSGPYGHRGDLTLISEAIHFHGGDSRDVRDAFFSMSQDDQNAVVEFLKSLQVLPPHDSSMEKKDNNDHGDRDDDD